MFPESGKEETLQEIKHRSKGSETNDPDREPEQESVIFIRKYSIQDIFDEKGDPSLRGAEHYRAAHRKKELRAIWLQKWE